MNNVIIDSSSVDDLLNKLADKDLINSILYGAVVDGAKTLQKLAQQSFIMKMGESANHLSPYLKGGKPFYEGVSVKGDKAYIEASVSIMNDFRMKFFEKGTKERFTKSRKITGYISRRKKKREGKGHYVGKITALNFFKAARENGKEIINKEMLDSILKNLNKKIKQ